MFILRLFCFSLFFSLALALPSVAIVIDDVGGSLKICQELVAIKHPINLAVIPGQAYSQKCAKVIAESPHQLLIHLPWAYLGKAFPKGYPIRFTKGLTAEEMTKMLDRAFASVSNANGINNHMGSQFSSSKKDVELFMQIYSKYKNSKYFLDSNTSRLTKAYATARKYGIKTAKNNFFLDGRQTPEYLERNFKAAVQSAKKNGTAIAICHGNRPVTLRLLSKLMDKYAADVAFVYLPEVIELRKQAELNLNYNKGI